MSRWPIRWLARRLAQSLLVVLHAAFTLSSGAYSVTETGTPFTAA